jgi:hypothetical protein
MSLEENLDDLDDMIKFLKNYNDNLVEQNKLLHSLLDDIHDNCDTLKPELLDIKAHLENQEKIENLNEVIKRENLGITSEDISDLRSKLDKYDNLDDLLKYL